MYELLVLLEPTLDLDDVERHVRLCVELAGGAADVARDARGGLAVDLGGWALSLARCDVASALAESTQLSRRGRAPSEATCAALARCTWGLEARGADDPGLAHIDDVLPLLRRLAELEGAHVLDPRAGVALPAGAARGPRLRPRDLSPAERAAARRVAPDEPLHRAIEEAPDGAVLLLGPGERALERPVAVSRAVHLVGEGAGLTRLRGPATPLADGVAAPAFELVGHGPLRVRGLRLELPAPRSHGAIARAGTIEVEDCVIDARAASRGAGLRLEGAALGGSIRRVAVLGGEVAVRVLGAARPRVEACVLRGGGAGVVFSEEARGAVRDCLLRERSSGVEAGGRARPLVTDNRIVQVQGDGLRWCDRAGGVVRGNEVLRAGEAGAAVDGGARPRLERNRLRDVEGKGVVYSRGSGGLCRDNVVERTGRSGIGALDGASPTLLHNRVDQAGQAGILVSGSSHAVVRGNEVTRAALHGVAVQDQACPTLEGNMVRSCGHNGLLWSTSAPLGRVRGNSFEDNGEGGVEVYDDGSPLVEGNRLVRNGKGGVVVGDRARPVLRGNEYHHNAVADVVILDQAAPDVQERPDRVRVQRPGAAPEAAPAEPARRTTTTRKKRRDAAPERPTTRWRLDKERAATKRGEASKKKTASRPATRRLKKGDVSPPTPAPPGRAARKKKKAKKGGARKHGREEP